MELSIPCHLGTPQMSGYVTGFFHSENWEREREREEKREREREVEIDREEEMDAVMSFTALWEVTCRHCTACYWSNPAMVRRRLYKICEYQVAGVIQSQLRTGYHRHKSSICH